MEPEVEVKEFDLEAFLKPKCPVKVGDRFYKNYKVPNHLVIYEVLKIDEVEDDKGLFYAITARSNNIQIGINTKVFSSRALLGDDYVILKKGENK